MSEVVETRINTEPMVNQLKETQSSPECHISDCETAEIYRQIKVERDEESEISERNEQDIPCVSTVPVEATADNEVFYYPTQAVLIPRSSLTVVPQSTYSVRLMQRIANKRKTIDALAQGALLNAEEAFLFEDTISNAKTSILVFDTKTKMEVERLNLHKENAKPMARKSSPNTVDTEKVTGDYPLIGSCYSLQPSSSDTAKPKNVRAISLAKQHVTTTYNTPAMAINLASTTVTSPTSPLNTTVSPRVRHQPNMSTSSIATSSTSISLLNRGSRSAELVQSPLNTPLPKQAISEELLTTNTIAIQSASSPRMAVCSRNSSPNSNATENLPPKAVFIPREVSVGSPQLTLQDCINVKDISDKQLKNWTTEDVAKFVRATDCCEYADAFIEQEIDGKALTLLNQDLLIQWMKLKLGPAMKLYTHILNLKHALQALQKM